MDGSVSGACEGVGQLPGSEEAAEQAELLLEPAVHCGPCKAEGKAKTEGKRERRSEGQRERGSPGGGRQLRCESFLGSAEKAEAADPFSFRPDAIQVPGAGAGNYSGRSFFNILLRHLLKSRSGFGLFARSSLGLTRRQGEVPAGTEDRSGRIGFPMPLPFPEALRKGWVAPADVVARKKMMNVVVITFNFLVLGRPSRPPASLRVGASLSSQQWEIIRRLEHFLEAWIFAEDVGPEAMGRTAPKVEGIEKTLLKLSSQVRLTNSLS